MEADGGASWEFLNSSLNFSSNSSSSSGDQSSIFWPYYQHSLAVAAIYCLAYILIFLLCIVGNVLVCIILLDNRRMRTVTNLFILNLAISDLLVGIFCIPTTLVDNLITGWPFSSLVCKMSGFIQGTSVSASVFTLVAIAVERFCCIVYPLRSKLSLQAAKASTVLIWLLAVGIMCPAALALTVEREEHRFLVHGPNLTSPLYSCYEDFAQPHMRRVYTAVLLAHIYLAPLTILALMYGSIGVKLYGSVLAQRRHRAEVAQDGTGGRHTVISQKKIKVIKMLILVTLLFMLSWLPLWTLMMMTDYAGLDQDQLDLLAGYIFPFAHWLAFSNSSINPIIYGYYNENFKRGLRAVCRSRSLSCLAGQRRRSSKDGALGREVPDGNVRLKRSNPVVRGTRNRVHIDDNFTDGSPDGYQQGALCSENCIAAFELAALNRSREEWQQRVPAGRAWDE